ncbi:MAG: hypothetical protein WBB82_15925 [Limnothrix sp.]
MLVILTDGQILPTDQVCQGCLMADHSGVPRMSHGKLRCGRAVKNNPVNVAATYQCEMGFRLAEIES